MRLTSFTDYTLRTLVYLGANRDRLVTIHDIAAQHGISENHLMKVVYRLGKAGVVETVRGRGGGMRLAKAPDEINLGEVVRASESDFNMAECFDGASNRCALTHQCCLRGALMAATEAYLAVLDGRTLDQLLGS